MASKHGVVMTGTLDNGRVVWDTPKADTGRLREMGNGRVVVRVDFASEKAIRSLKANRYYWYALGLIAKETGNDRDDLHEYYKDRFLKRKVYLVDKRTGEATEAEIAQSTTKLQADDFWTYTEAVRRHAAEFFNVNIPDPDPEWRRDDARRAS